MIFILMRLPCGNKPSCSQQGNWIEADGSGRTFYVGKRKNGKLLRVYEKGKQLGDTSSLWVRWELELHNRDRIIPWDVILAPGKYLAASYDRYVAPCNICIPRIPVGYTGGTTPRMGGGRATHGVVAESNAGAVTEERKL